MGLIRNGRGFESRRFGLSVLFPLFRKALRFVDGRLPLRARVQGGVESLLHLQWRRLFDEVHTTHLDAELQFPEPVLEPLRDTLFQGLDIGKESLVDRHGTDAPDDGSTQEALQQAVRGLAVGCQEIGGRTRDSIAESPFAVKDVAVAGDAVAIDAWNQRLRRLMAMAVSGFLLAVPETIHVQCLLSDGDEDDLVDGLRPRPVQAGLSHFAHLPERALADLAQVLDHGHLALFRDPNP